MTCRQMTERRILSRPTRACELKFDYSHLIFRRPKSRPTRACELKCEDYDGEWMTNYVTPHAGV